MLLEGCCSLISVSVHHREGLSCAQLAVAITDVQFDTCVNYRRMHAVCERRNSIFRNPCSFHQGYM